MACTLGSGAKAGVFAALGMAIGSLIYIGATALGLGALVVYYPTLLLVVQVMGAVYLCWLGFNAIRHAKCPDTKKTVAGRPLTLARQSVLVELSNPKTFLFFIAFLPQFADPNSSQLAMQLITLGVIYCVIALFSDLFVVTMSHQIGRWIQSSRARAVRQEQIAGLVLIAVGVFIIVDAIDT